MNAKEALESFRQKCAVGMVANARDGTFGPISDSVQAAIESSYRAAITFASDTSDLAQIPYEAYADDLAKAAVDHAREYGLSDGSNRAARCRRFVVTVDGRVRSNRRTGADAMPPRWLGMHQVLSDHEAPLGPNARNTGYLIAFAQLAASNGVHDPAGLPDLETIRRWSEESERSLPKFNHMTAAYRLARRLYLGAHPHSEVPDLDRQPVARERGLRSLPDIAERLAAAGYHGPVGKIESVEVIRVLAPRWYPVMQGYIKDKRGDRSKGFPKLVIGASSRILAALVQTGLGSLESAHPLQLLLREVEVDAPVDGDRIASADWDILAQEFGIDLVRESDSPGCGTRQVMLLEALAYACAPTSAERSPLKVVNAKERRGPVFWSESVISDTRTVAALATFAGEVSGIFAAQRERAQKTADETTALLRHMVTENSRVSFSERKAKASLLALITMPMAVCLGIPALRLRALKARNRWERLLLREDGGKAAERAERRYDKYLLQYLIFAIFLADGLRLANYSGARIGRVGRVEMSSGVAPCGTQVRSFCHIEPILNANKDGLVGVKTNFYGDDHPEVKLKMAKVAGSGEWRERAHWLRPGMVDMELVWDFLTRARPRNLAAQGLIASAAEYCIEQDMATTNFAFFVSATPSSDPYRAVTGAFTPGTISQKYGRALHWVCTRILGRTLPDFGPALRKAYPRVFSGHSSRLMVGTHLFGILRRATDVAVLLNDTISVVEERYSVTEASMMHKTGWEHPRFFDEYFIRIWDKGEVIDWRKEDPLAGIPKSDRPGGLHASEARR